MYHDIVSSSDKTSGFQNDSAFQYKVEEEAFEAHVKALQGKDVVFTFDDGGMSFYTTAAPILETYGFRGLFFISTNYIGTPGFLSIVQIKDLEKRGHVIGSHSHTHPHDFTKLMAEEIQYEWNESMMILRDILGDAVIPASIPNGYSSNQVVEQAFKCGYSDIYTSEPTVIIKHKHKHRVIGRYVVHNGMRANEVLQIVESASTRRRIYIKWLGLEIVKGILGKKYDKVKALVLSRK